MLHEKIDLSSDDLEVPVAVLFLAVLVGLYTVQLDLNLSENRVW